jgi:hypothetical protein
VETQPAKSDSNTKAKEEIAVMEKDVDFFRSEIKTYWKNYQKNYSSIKPLTEFKKEDISNPRSEYPGKEYFVKEEIIVLKGKGEEVSEFNIKTKKSRLDHDKPELTIIIEITASFSEKLENLKLSIKTITPGEDPKLKQVVIGSLTESQKLQFVKLYRNKLQEILKNLELYNNYMKLDTAVKIEETTRNLSSY